MHLCTGSTGALRGEFDGGPCISSLKVPGTTCCCPGTAGEQFQHTTCVCVCVHPWAKGSPPPPFPRFSTNFFNQQGMETPVLLLHQRSWQYMVRISVPDAELTYLLSTHRLQWSTLLLFRWFHGCSHDGPQDLFPPQTCSRLAATLSVRSSFRVPLQTKLNHTVFTDLCALRFFAFLPIGKLS